MDYIDSYYRSTLSTVAQRPALDADIDTEVCVVGGGLAGLATALGLRERGVGQHRQQEAGRQRQYHS